MSDVENVQDLMAHAYAMELEASERYAEFADVMATHNNRDVAELFAKLARIEQLHAGQILSSMGWTQAPAAASGDYRWLGMERPETGDHTELHYLMTPWHALQLSLSGEKRALANFTRIVETATDPKVKALAEELAGEEAEHGNRVHRLLRRYPKPEDSWAADPDPPASPE